MTMPLARKIYWSISLVGLVIVWGGMTRKHLSHEAHGLCNCMQNCIACGIDGLRGK